MRVVTKALLSTVAACAVAVTAPGLALASTPTVPTTGIHMIPSEPQAYWTGVEQGRREGRINGADDARAQNCQAGSHVQNEQRQHRDFGTQSDFDRGRLVGQGQGYTIGWDMVCNGHNNGNGGWEGQDDTSRQRENQHGHHHGH